MVSDIKLAGPTNAPLASTASTSPTAVSLGPIDRDRLQATLAGKGELVAGTLPEAKVQQLQAMRLDLQSESESLRSGRLPQAILKGLFGDPSA